jgi:hypothetical protein
MQSCREIFPLAPETAVLALFGRGQRKRCNRAVSRLGSQFCWHFEAELPGHSLSTAPLRAESKGNL